MLCCLAGFAKGIELALLANLVSWLIASWRI
jgi:hypothetical protein